MRLGIDFGTTNSAVAVLEGGRARIVELVPGEPVQRTVVHAGLDRSVRYGNAAFRSYVEEDLSGRFLRSLKSFLSQDVPPTWLAGKKYHYYEIIGHFLRFLIDRAELVCGQPATEIVLGRPVRFHDDDARSAQAEQTLRQAARRAGIEDFRFVLEPVAAAHRYEAGLEQDKTVLVGDFGGGTADFAILRVGPSRVGRPGRQQDVLAISGVAQAGDALDALFMDAFLMGFFGKGAPLREPTATGQTSWSSTLHTEIQRLFYLHQLREPALERGLRRMQDRLVDPIPAERVRRLVFEDLGYPMAWSIEAAKRGFSEQQQVPFVFDQYFIPRLEIRTRVDRQAYSEHAAQLLARYDAAVSQVLRDASLTESQVHSVFLTGGTSQLPFIRERFRQRFGPHAIGPGDAMTSVCEGLALAAKG